MMHAQTPDSPKDRELLRRYLLDTLSASARRRVAARLAESAEWRQALDAERNALEVFDQLEDRPPMQDLTAAVMERVRAHNVDAETKTLPPRAAWRRAAVYAAVALVVAGLIVPFLIVRREEQRRQAAVHRMKQLGVAFKMYANDHREYYPPLTPYEDVWMFDVAALYPDYLTDLTVLVNPRLANADQLHRELEALAGRQPPDWERITRIAAQSYTYLPYVVRDEREAQALAKARAKAPPSEYNADTLQAGDVTLRRVREGIERFFITDINNPAAANVGQSEIPVLFENIEQVRQRKHKNANVLYMDGHVECLAYGPYPSGDFPITEGVADAFAQPQE